MRREFIIAGHSHIFAMGAKQSHRGSITLEEVEVDGCSGFFLNEEWRGDRSLEYWDNLISHAHDRHVIIVFNGNQHFGKFLITPPPVFDFIDSSTPAIPLYSGAIVLPRRLVAQFFSGTLLTVRKLIPRIQAAGSTTVTLLGTPPPKSDFTAFLDNVKKAEFFKGVAKKRNIDIGSNTLLPPSIMLKLWRVLQEQMSVLSTECKASFLPVFPEAFDNEGYIQSKFQGADLTHANIDYGRLALKYAVQFVEGA